VWDEDFEEYHFSKVTDFIVEEGNVATTLVLTHDGRQERFKAPTERAREVRERLTEALIAYHEVDSIETLRERFAVDEEESPSATMSFGEGPTPLSANPSELRDRPENSTRSDPDDLGDVDDVVSADTSGETVEPEPDSGVANTVETADTANAPDSPEDAAEEAADSASEPGGIDSIGTGDLLGPAETAPTDTAPEPVEPSTTETATGDDIAALTAEVEALRETVEAQNERIEAQEELLKQLIAELRQRL
jgi:hypothetical protein